MGMGVCRCNGRVVVNGRNVDMCIVGIVGTAKYWTRADSRTRTSIKTRANTRTRARKRADTRKLHACHEILQKDW